MMTDIDVPSGVTVQADAGTVIVKGPKGEITRTFTYPGITITVANAQIKIISARATAREKKMVNTFEAHLNNMIRGAQEGHVYKLKICSGHFPMTVAAAGNEFIVKNFLGEKYPRTLPIDQRVKVNVQGQEVVVEGAALELVSQCAANIEKLTLVRNRDRRIFQDGIYITVKDGQPIEG